MGLSGAQKKRKLFRRKLGFFFPETKHESAAVVLVPVSQPSMWQLFVVKFFTTAVGILAQARRTRNNRLLTVFDSDFYNRPFVRSHDKMVQGIGFVASLISASTFGDTLVSFLRFPGKANRFLNISSNCPPTVKVTASTETKATCLLQCQIFSPIFLFFSLVEIIPQLPHA